MLPYTWKNDFNQAHAERFTDFLQNCGGKDQWYGVRYPEYGYQYRRWGRKLVYPQEICWYALHIREHLTVSVSIICTAAHRTANTEANVNRQNQLLPLSLFCTFYAETVCMLSLEIPSELHVSLHQTLPFSYVGFYSDRPGRKCELSEGKSRHQIGQVGG